MLESVSLIVLKLERVSLIAGWVLENVSLIVERMLESVSRIFECMLESMSLIVLMLESVSLIVLMLDSGSLIIEWTIESFFLIVLSGDNSGIEEDPECSETEPLCAGLGTIGTTTRYPPVKVEDLFNHVMTRKKVGIKEEYDVSSYRMVRT